MLCLLDSYTVISFANVPFTFPRPAPSSTRGFGPWPTAATPAATPAAAGNEGRSSPAPASAGTSNNCERRFSPRRSIGEHHGRQKIKKGGKTRTRSQRWRRGKRALRRYPVRENILHEGIFLLTVVLMISIRATSK